VALPDQSAVTVELAAFNSTGIADVPDKGEFAPQWGVFVVHESKQVVLAFRNSCPGNDWKSKAAFDTAGPGEESELDGALFPGTIYAAVTSHMAAIMADVGAALGKWGAEYSLQICGHSLGGSLASTFALLALGDVENSSPGGVLMKHDFRVVTFGAPLVACIAPATGDIEAETLQDIWEGSELESSLGPYLAFTKARWANVVNEYDMVPRAFGNKVNEADMTAIQWPKALAKATAAARRLELAWLDHALKEKDAVQDYDVVGSLLAVASGAEVDGEGAPLFRVYKVATDWEAAYLRLDMRTNENQMRKSHALSTYCQNLGTALSGLLSPSVSVALGGFGFVTGGPTDSAGLKAKAVPWPLEADSKLVVNWSSAMFREGPTIDIKIRLKAGAAPSWAAEKGAARGDETVEFTSDDMVQSLGVGEYVVELSQGAGEHRISCATSPFHLTVNKTRLAAMRKKAADEAKEVAEKLKAEKAEAAAKLKAEKEEAAAKLKAEKEEAAAAAKADKEAAEAAKADEDK